MEEFYKTLFTLLKKPGQFDRNEHFSTATFFRFILVGMLLVTSFSESLAQTRIQITGKLTDEKNEPIIAGVALLQSSNPAAGTYVNNQAELRERIRDERRREFPNEGIEFFDEMRWKTFKDKVFYPGNGGKIIWGAIQFTYSYAGDKLYNWPIPQVEIERNSNLVQNKDW